MRAAFGAAGDVKPRVRREMRRERCRKLARFGMRLRTAGAPVQATTRSSGSSARGDEAFVLAASRASLRPGSCATASGAGPARDVGEECERRALQSGRRRARPARRCDECPDLAKRRSARAARRRATHQAVWRRRRHAPPCALARPSRRRTRRTIRRATARCRSPRPRDGASLLRAVRAHDQIRRRRRARSGYRPAPARARGSRRNRPRSRISPAGRADAPPAPAPVPPQATCVSSPSRPERRDEDVALRFRLPGRHRPVRADRAHSISGAWLSSRTPRICRLARLVRSISPLP